MTEAESRTSSKHVRSVADSVFGIGIVKLIAFYKEIIVAATLSVSGGYDVFLFYLALPGFPTAVFLNPLQSVLIRKISRLQNKSGNRAGELENQYMSSVTFSLFFILPVVYFIWFAGFKVLTEQFGFFSQVHSENYQMKIWYFAPYAIFSAINIILYGYLQSRGSFRLNSIWQAVTPVISIIFLKIWQIYLIFLLTRISTCTFFESIVLLILLKKFVGINFSFRRFRFGIFTKLMMLSSGLVLGFLMTSLTPLIESIILFSSKAGDISSYSYASKLPMAISSVLVTTAAIVSLPILSQMFSVPKKREILKKYFFAINLLLIFAGVLCAGAMNYYSANIVGLVFRSAHFSSDLIVHMGGIQGYLFFQIPFAVVSIIST